MTSIRFTAIFLTAVLFCFSFASGYKLTIIHTNDAHAKFEQTNEKTSDCKPETEAEGKCFGGVPRRVTKVKELRETYPNAILLDAGDQFQGTFWYNYYKGEAAAHFMNMMNYEAMALGNHEFDDGIDVLVSFIDNVTFPVLSSNVDISKETKLQGQLGKSTKLQVGGETIGIVGYTTEDVQVLSNPGNTVTFTSIKISVQAEIDKLVSENVNKIIALGHAGYTIDKKLAEELKGVDVVVGGHSHSFLYTGKEPSIEKSEGDYPTTILNKHSQKEVLVVTAYAYGKYVGLLELEFDASGDITKWNGAPVLLDNSTIQDPAALVDLNRMDLGIEKYKKKEIGSSLVELEGDTNYCRTKECNMGNMITDATVWYFMPKSPSLAPTTGWTTAAIALLNGGGIRAPIEKGTITLYDASTTQPYGNTIDMISLKGDVLLKVLEQSASGEPGKYGGFLQYSGVHVTYNLNNAIGSRVVSAEVLCADCDVPRYSPIDPAKFYKILTNRFLIKGGDGYSVIKDNAIDIQLIGEIDVSIMQAYIERFSPLTSEVEGRIKILTEATCGANNLSSQTVTHVLIICCVIYSAIMKFL